MARTCGVQRRAGQPEPPALAARCVIPRRPGTTPCGVSRVCSWWPQLRRPNAQQIPSALVKDPPVRVPPAASVTRCACTACKVSGPATSSHHSRYHAPPRHCAAIAALDELAVIVPMRRQTRPRITVFGIRNPGAPTPPAALGQSRQRPVIPLQPTTLGAPPCPRRGGTADRKRVIETSSRRTASGCCGSCPRDQARIAPARGSGPPHSPPTAPQVAEASIKLTPDRRVKEPRHHAPWRDRIYPHRAAGAPAPASATRKGAGDPIIQPGRRRHRPIISAKHPD